LVVVFERLQHQVNYCTWPHNQSPIPAAQHQSERAT
jgi:hypothetical protein